MSSRAAESGSSWQSPYVIEPDSITSESNKEHAIWNFAVRNRLAPSNIRFKLSFGFLKDGMIRIQMDEKDGIRQRYNESASWALLPDQPVYLAPSQVKQKCTSTQCTFNHDSLQVLITFTPIRVHILRDALVQLDINSRGLLHMEHFRLKQEPVEQAIDGNDTETVLHQQQNNSDWTWTGSQPFEDPNTEGLWEETWSGKQDTKPKGPEAFSIDLNFPQSRDVFGLPEHASPLNLVTTDGSQANGFDEPYRMYNVDIFEYLAHSPMAMYGAVSLLHAVNPKSTLSVLMLSGSETWIDIIKPEDGGTNTHWITESGTLDLFILPGPTPQQSIQQYATLTGTPAMPQLFAIGYHQCRWNYISEADVLEVNKQFDLADIPLDTLWLDIEYATEHKYFEFNPKTFPNPGQMLDKLSENGRHLVAIVDPHVKRANEFYVYSEARDQDLFVKNSGNTEFDGHCWTGSSAWVDFFNRKAHEWWATLFKFTKWTVSRSNLYIWNDMNEPSVFNGPEITMPKDNIHFGGWEHRDVHNINGMLFQMATHQALLQREAPGVRPFVLTRSYFAGSQRYGASWTGDNLGTWSHLAGSVPMLLSNNIAGQTFSGADVGGFFGNPEPEMLARWYQAGIFAGFFRAHAHIDTKRREPYLLEEPYFTVARDAIRLRYTLLSVWYTAFYESHLDGSAIMKPHFVDDPQNGEGYSVDDQYLIANSGLLVKPVVQPGMQSVDIYLPDLQPYYGWYDRALHRRQKDRPSSTVNAPLDKIPLLIRGGSIIPIRTRFRRAAPLMWQDPLTLIVTVDSKNTAEGTYYSDDGRTFEFQNGSFVYRKFYFDGKILRSTAARNLPSTTIFNEHNQWAQKISHVEIEKIQIWGLSNAPRVIRMAGRELSFSFTAETGGKASELIIKKPAALIAYDWEMTFDGERQKGDYSHEDL